MKLSLNYNKFWLSVLVFIFFVLPFVSFAALVPTGCATNDSGCEFGDFIELIKNIMNFAIFTGVAFSVLAFSWAGILMITSAGNTGQRDQAKKIFSSVLTGFLIVLTAWLIVYLILKGLTEGSNAKFPSFIENLRR